MCDDKTVSMILPTSNTMGSFNLLVSTGYYLSPVSSNPFSHSAFPAPSVHQSHQAINFSQLVITQVQSPVSILKFSHSSSFSSPISTGSVVNWLLLKSDIQEYLRFTEMFYVW